MSNSRTLLNKQRTELNRKVIRKGQPFGRHLPSGKGTAHVSKQRWTPA